MSVEKLKDGRWLVRFPKGKDPDNPSKIKKYFGRGPDAEAAAIAWNEEIGLGKAKTITTPTFHEIAEGYVASKRGKIAESSIKNLVYQLKGNLLPNLGEYMAHRITHDVLDIYVAKRTGEGKKRTSIHREVTDIIAILNWATKRGKIASNPASGYEKPKRDDAIINPPTTQEIKAIWKAAAPHLQRALLISFYTGLRPGAVELFTLTWEDVDLVNETILVRSAQKGGIARRVVPINQSIKNKLVEWYDEDQGKGYLITYKGIPIKSIKTAWNAAKKRARISRRIRPYDLRHAAITGMLEAGADLKSVSEIVGHADPQMTLRVYQHTKRSMHKNAIGSLPDIGLDDD